MNGCYTINLICMTGFCNSICIFHIVEIIGPLWYDSCLDREQSHCSCISVDAYHNWGAFYLVISLEQRADHIADLLSNVCSKLTLYANMFESSTFSEWSWNACIVSKFKPTKRTNCQQISKLFWPNLVPHNNLKQIFSMLAFSLTNWSISLVFDFK